MTSFICFILTLSGKFHTPSMLNEFSKYIRNVKLDQTGDHRRVSDSSTCLMRGERKNSITRLLPVLTSAVTAIPGEMES